MGSDIQAHRLKQEASAAKVLLDEIGTDDDDFRHDIVEGETSFLEAIEKAIAEMDDCTVIIDGCASVEATIAARRKKAEERLKRIRGLIEQAMVVVGMDSARLPTATVTVRKVKPKAIVTDEALLPSEYWKQPEPVVDLSKVSKLDAPVPGVTMSNGGTSLQIRRV